MPVPSAPKITRLIIVDWVNAKPTAAPINGAVQGAATTVASTPVAKEARYPELGPSPPSDITEVPISKIPSRFNAIRKNK